MRFIRPDGKPVPTRECSTKRNADMPDTPDGAPRRKAIGRRVAYGLLFALVLLIAFLAFLIHFLSTWALDTFRAQTHRTINLHPQ